jgi:hypothetical protein
MRHPLSLCVMRRCRVASAIVLVCREPLSCVIHHDRTSLAAVVRRLLSSSIIRHRHALSAIVVHRCRRHYKILFCYQMVSKFL